MYATPRPRVTDDPLYAVMQPSDMMMAVVAAMVLVFPTRRAVLSEAVQRMRATCYGGGIAFAVLSLFNDERHDSQQWQPQNTQEGPDEINESYDSIACCAGNWSKRHGAQHRDASAGSTQCR